MELSPRKTRASRLPGLRCQAGGRHPGGADVPYGDEGWLRQNASDHEAYGFQGPMFGFPHLYNVRRGTPQGAVGRLGAQGGRRPALPPDACR